MPVERIDDALDQPGEVPQFAVLGRYSLGARFVEHVGLLAKQENWKSLQSEVHVHEMGISAKVGPLSIESIDEPPTMKGDLIGYVELRKTHRNAIKTYLAELDDDVARNGSGFIIMPPSDRSSRLYSCSGLVHECYELAGVPLIFGNSLPAVKLHALCEFFPSMQVARNRHRCGLTGDGGWPILMPGYLFHSLERDHEAILAAPKSIDSIDQCFYPAR